MSLYIGHRSDNNKPLVHLTSGAHNQVDISSVPINDTLFHSDLKYMRVVKIIRFNREESYVNIGYGTYAANFYSSDSWQQYKGKFAMYVINCANNLTYSGVTASDIIGTGKGSFLGENLVYGNSRSNNLSDYNRISHYIYANLSTNSADSIDLIVFDYIASTDSIIGYPVTLSSLIVNSEILISNSDINIGGVSISNQMFITMPDYPQNYDNSYVLVYPVTFSASEQKYAKYNRSTFEIFENLTYTYQWSNITSKAPYAKGVYMLVSGINKDTTVSDRHTSIVSNSYEQKIIVNGNMLASSLYSHNSFGVYLGRKVWNFQGSPNVSIGTISLPPNYVHGTSKIIFYGNMIFTNSSGTSIIRTYPFMVMYNGRTSIAQILPYFIDIYTYFRADYSSGVLTFKNGARYDDALGGTQYGKAICDCYIMN